MFSCYRLSKLFLRILPYKLWVIYFNSMDSHPSHQLLPKSICGNYNKTVNSVIMFYLYYLQLIGCTQSDEWHFPAERRTIYFRFYAGLQCPTDTLAISTGSFYCQVHFVIFGGFSWNTWWIPNLIRVLFLLSLDSKCSWWLNCYHADYWIKSLWSYCLVELLVSFADQFSPILQ